MIITGKLWQREMRKWKNEMIYINYYILLIIPIFYIAGWIIWYIRTGGAPTGQPRIISFHKISLKPEFGGTFVFPAQFRAFMTELHNNKFKTVCIEENINNKDNVKSISIFFDDAYESVFTFAYPIMKEFGQKGVIAPVAGYIGKKNHWDRGNGSFMHMNEEQIKMLSDNGFEIISHTMNHYDLRKLSDNKLEYELKESKNMLELITGKPVQYLLYPYGLYNDRVIRKVKECGYSGAFASYSRDNRRIKRYAMGRNSIYIIDTIADFKIIIKRAPLFLYGHEETKGRIINWFARFSEVIKL